MDFTNTSGIRSPFSPRVRQSVSGRRQGLSSAKKNQSKFMQSAEAPTGDVIYKTPLTTVETFGHPLPVLVTEALTFASGEVTVRLSPCGYCWLVCGRRLLCWARDGGGAARELTLPQTDLQHRAELVEVFYEDDAQMPSCIGVSPEGVVRYWPSVGQELYADTSCELAGQECARLCAASAGLLLATTSCSLLLLHPEPHRPGVVCRTLRPPSGWLGGLGRRVSLLFFGSMPASADTKLVGVVIVQDGPMSASAEQEPGYIALVGGGGGAVLQLWRGADLHEHNLRRALLDAHRPHGDVNSLQVVCLDVRAGGPRALALLVAVANVARSPEMRYAVAHMSVEDPANPRVTSLVPLRGCVLPADSAPRLLALPAAALLYTSTAVARVSSTVGNEKVEYIDVGAEGDRILGAELCAGRALLFSRKHGVLALAAADAGAVSADVSVCESPMGSPCPSDMCDGNLSLYEIDPNEVSMVTTDACGKLKTAFLFHLRRSTSACRALLEELFPARARAHEPDAALARTVLRVVADLLDDAPQGDPRWKPRGGPATNIPLGSSSALQVTAQLRDKQRALALFCDFLRAAGLWQRLGSVTPETGGECISTVTALGLLAEKLAIALALRKQQSSDSQLIDAAIYQVVCGDDATPDDPEVEEALSSGALAPSDVCFRRVSRIQRVLCALATAQPAAGDVRSHAQHAAHACRLLTSVMSGVQAARAAWGPWPAPALGPGALLPALLGLHHRAVTQHGPNCPDAAARAQLYEAAALLADLALAEAEPLRRGAHTAHVADKIRRDVIRPYIEAGQTERAAVLAEKFKELELLVEMCVQQDDVPRLCAYIDKLADEGMSEIAFAYLMDRGGLWAARLVRELGARYPARLQAWLARAPRRAPLLALHHLAAPAPAPAPAGHTPASHAPAPAGRAPAARLLARLADAERDRLARRATMASLAKLCLLASEEDSESSELWGKVDSILALADQQLALPRDIKILHALDQPDCRVVPAADLVQMYIDSESAALTEYDYKKALDLTDFVEDMELRDDLRLRVWCACIRRSSWEDCNVEAPAEELQTKMFFRLMHLVHVMGGDLQLLLPAPEDVATARELADLAGDPRFRFLVKLAYQCFQARAQPDDL